MNDTRLLDQISASCDHLHIRYNAHRDANTTVARHLLHRERLGEAVQFQTAEAKSLAIDTDSLWELTIIGPRGSDAHFGASSFHACVSFAASHHLFSMPSAAAA